MGSVAGGGGEEEKENLSAVNMLHTTSSIHLLNTLVVREGTRGSQQKGHKKRDSRGQVVGV